MRKKLFSSAVLVGACTLLCITPMRVTGETYSTPAPESVGVAEILNPVLTDEEKEEILKIGLTLLHKSMYGGRDSLENALDRANINPNEEYEYSGWKNRWGVTELTDYEKRLLAEITWLEAGNQHLTGQEYVVVTILNRLISDDFDDSIEGVLSADGQFTTWKKRAKAEPTNETYQAIEDVLSGKADEKILNANFHYFNTSHGEVHIGDHWFSE